MDKPKVKLWVSAVFSFVFAAVVFGAALTANRDTRERSGDSIVLVVKNDEVIYAGSLVSLDSNGEAVSATDTAGERVMGRAAVKVDNADDGETIKVERGVFAYGNAGDISDADIGKLAYILDDQTVSQATNGNGVVAGRIIDFTGEGVWVAVGFIDHDVDNRAVLVGPDTTLQTYEEGTCTNGQVITFGTAFAANPRVYLTPTTHSVTGFVSSISTTQATCNCDGSVTMQYLAIGDK